MKECVDLIVIGAGPGGLAAATEAARSGLSVLVLDEQPVPGGQIWRSVESVSNSPVGDILGPEYQRGAERVAAFRASGAAYESNIRVWQIEPGWTVFASRGNEARSYQAKRILLATGAQERPAPFPGWTTPGVMTVGAAQILLKSSREIPDEPVWIAGSGPLPLLYVAQLLRAGGSVAGWLSTTPKGALERAIPHFVSASKGWRDLLKGFKWMREIARSHVHIEKSVAGLRALAGEDGKLEQIEYTTAAGVKRSERTRLLLVHEGVVPSIHITQALGCRHDWDDSQHCFAPYVDEWGHTSVAGIFVAGDGAGIGGAAAATTRGEIAAIGIAAETGHMSPADAERLAAPLRHRLSEELAVRGLLDAIYKPRKEIFAPADGTIVCRCEELTAGEIRTAAVSGRPSADRIKSITRAGMGPCQGRQCGYTVMNIIAAAQGCRTADVGFYRIRPPLKPLTLGELASLDDVGNDRATV